MVLETTVLVSRMLSLLRCQGLDSFDVRAAAKQNTVAIHMIPYDTLNSLITHQLRSAASPFRTVYLALHSSRKLLHTPWACIPRRPSVRRTNRRKIYIDLQLFCFSCPSQVTKTKRSVGACCTRSQASRRCLELTSVVSLQ